MFASTLAVLGLTACEKGLVDEAAVSTTGQVGNSVLLVRTRGASGDGATVAYPVAVYVFEGDECKASQTIGDEGQTLNIALTEGTYSVYAVGGVSSSDYVLPSVSDALTSSAIALQERKVLTDLMTASATETLVDGGTNTVTLGMTRMTMLIQDVTIKKVPSTATAVTVTIAPLWQKPDHRRDIQHDERQQHHCADSPRGREDVEEQRQCLSAATKQSARQRECEHHYGRHNENLYLQHQRRTGGWLQDQY